MEKNRKVYGFSTAVAMVVGIVVGSGIFFKADNILLATGGNIKIGILVLCIGALGIIFGSLTLSELAIRTNSSGGFVSYFEKYISKKFGSGFGFFQTFIYLPSVTAVLAYATVMFACITFEVNLSYEVKIFLGFILLILITLLNTYNRKLGGNIQFISTIIKLIPIFAIAIYGLFYKGTYPQVPSQYTLVSPKNIGYKWIASLAPIAFSFDGWPIVTTIVPELKNPKRTMPLVLILSPILILLSYLLYFLGIINILGSTYIMSLQDDSVYTAFNIMLGPIGAKFLIFLVTIAIFGVINGVILGGIRMPQALAEKGIAFDESVAKIDEKLQISKKSAFIYFLISTFWLIAYYITSKFQLLGGSDVSEIAIVFSYVTYIVLYLKVMKLYKEGEIKSLFKGIIAPIFAIIGSLIILIGGIVASPFYVILYIFVSIFIFYLGYRKIKDE